MSKTFSAVKRLLAISPLQLADDIETSDVVPLRHHLSLLMETLEPFLDAQRIDCVNSDWKDTLKIAVVRQHAAFGLTKAQGQQLSECDAFWDTFAITCFLSDAAHETDTDFDFEVYIGFAERKVEPPVDDDDEEEEDGQVMANVFAGFSDDPKATRVLISSTLVGHNKDKQSVNVTFEGRDYHETIKAAIEKHTSIVIDTDGKIGAAWLTWPFSFVLFETCEKLTKVIKDVQGVNELVSRHETDIYAEHGKHMAKIAQDIIDCSTELLPPLKQENDSPPPSKKRKV